MDKGQLPRNVASSWNWEFLNRLAMLRLHIQLANQLALCCTTCPRVFHAESTILGKYSEKKIQKSYSKRISYRKLFPRCH